MSTQSDPLKVTTQELPLIVIAGDSWGRGEWVGTKDIEHEGLAQYCREAGHEVINLSQAGAGFRDIEGQIDCAHALLDWCPPSRLIRVFVFQTEWFRHFIDAYQYYEDFNIQFHVRMALLVETVISKWYYTLSQKAQRYQIQIGLIGGCSDTIWLDQFSQEYPNLYVACQSVTNLCVNDDHRIDQPVFALNYSSSNAYFLKKLCRTNEDYTIWTDQISLGLYRRDLWLANRYWFYPDGMHANRHGHKKLYDFLREQNFI